MKIKLGRSFFSSLGMNHGSKLCLFGNDFDRDEYGRNKFRALLFGWINLDWCVLNVYSFPNSLTFRCDRIKNFNNLWVSTKKIQENEQGEKKIKSF